jgi:hypothetical protein
MKEVRLPSGEIALVDDDDYDLVMQYRWGKKRMSGDLWYVRSTTNPRIWMHRLVTGTSPREKNDIDHVNHNTFDNQKENLTVASRSDNQINRKGARSDSSTDVRGVSYLPNAYRFSPYRASAQIQGRRVYFGHYATLEEARQAVEAGRPLAHPYEHAN